MISQIMSTYTPDTLPYHLIVPSLPGYAFSESPPLDRELSVEEVARLFDRLAVGLGFGNGYMVQGGDLGSKVGRIMAANHDTCKGMSVCTINLTCDVEVQ